MALLFLPISQLGCASSSAISAGRAEPQCPTGMHGDPSRQARIFALLRDDAESAILLSTERVDVCFGAGFQRGVISEDMAFLDEKTGDGELAARLAHLLVHHRDKLGDGCAAGLQAARDSEAQAARLEQRLLRRLGFDPAPPRDESAQDYAQRCRGDSTRIGDGRTI